MDRPEDPQRPGQAGGSDRDVNADQVVYVALFLKEETMTEELVVGGDNVVWAKILFLKPMMDHHILKGGQNV